MNTDIIDEKIKCSIVLKKLNIALLRAEMAKEFRTDWVKPMYFFTDNQSVLKYVNSLTFYSFKLVFVS